jgi:hypothetical protein
MRPRTTQVSGGTRQIRAGNESPTRVVKFNLHGPLKFRFSPKPILPIAAGLAPATFEQLVRADGDLIDEFLISTPPATLGQLA